MINIPFPFLICLLLSITSPSIVKMSTPLLSLTSLPDSYQPEYTLRPIQTSPYIITTPHYLPTSPPYNSFLPYITPISHPHTHTYTHTHTHPHIHTPTHTHTHTYTHPHTPTPTQNAELSYNFGAEKFKFPPQFGSRGLSSAVSDHVVSSSKGYVTPLSIT